MPLRAPWRLRRQFWVLRPRLYGDVHLSCDLAPLYSTWHGREPVLLPLNPQPTQGARPGTYLLHAESQFRCSYAPVGKSQFVKIHDRFFPSICFNRGNFISYANKQTNTESYNLTPEKHLGKADGLNGSKCALSPSGDLGDAPVPPPDYPALEGPSADLGLKN